MSGHSVRRLGVADAAAFRDIRLDGLERHPEAFGASLEIERDQPPAFFEGRLRDNAIFGGFDVDGDLVGVAGLRVDASPKTRHVATFWGMYVQDQARRTGLARRLVQAALDAVPADCRSVRLSVVSTNAAAIGLYQSFGFTTWALDVEALRVGGRYYDEVLMRLDLE